MILVNLLSLLIFFYVIYVKINNIIYHHTDGYTLFRYMLLYFNLLLVTSVMAMILAQWHVIDMQLMMKILSWCFFGFAVVSLKANTDVYDRGIQWFRNKKSR